MKKIALTLLLALLFPLLLDGAQRRRAVRPPVTSEVTIKGKVVDAADGRPLPNVTVEFADMNAITDARGEFAIERSRVTSSATLTARRAGYTAQTVTIPASQLGAVEIRMQATAFATLTTLNGASYKIDPDTLEFGYVVAFVGYTKKDSIAICKGANDTVTVSRRDLKRIPGPATSTPPGTCCALPTESITLELRDGSTVQGVIKDSCTGYTFDVIATDVVTGQTVYVRMKEINRLLMP